MSNDREQLNPSKSGTPTQTPTTAPVLKDTDDRKPVDNDSSKPKSTKMTLSASYTNVPGATKGAPSRAKAGNALWFDPVYVAVKSPREKRVQQVTGVTVGSGQEIGTTDVPLNERGPNKGAATGEIAAQLKYTPAVHSSYSITVTGVKDNKKDAVKAVVKEFLGGKRGLASTGDLDLLQVDAVEAVKKQLPDIGDVKVTIAPLTKDASVADAGRSEIFFKAIEDPSILLHVPVVVVAQQTIRSGGGSTKAQGSDVDVAGSHATDRQTVDIHRDQNSDVRTGSAAQQTYTDQWAQARKQRVERIVTQFQTFAKTSATELTKKLQADSSFHDNWKEEWFGNEIDVSSGTSSKDTNEKSGEKDDKNWAAYLEDLAKAGESIIDYIKPAPVKWIRQIGIGLGITKALGNVFAVRGKIKYRDLKETATNQSTKVGTNKSGGSGNHDVTQATDANLEQKLTELILQTASNIQRLSSTVTDTAAGGRRTVATQVAGGRQTAEAHDDYRYDANREQGSGSLRARANQSTLTELRYETTLTETTTAPVLMGSVVEGKGEVKSTPFDAADATKKE